MKSFTFIHFHMRNSYTNLVVLQEELRKGYYVIGSFTYWRWLASLFQVVVKSSVAPISQVTSPGTSILAEGLLKQPSNTGKRVIELEVENILHIGTVDLTKYPLTKTRLPLEFLRNYSHLRPRTTMVILASNWDLITFSIWLSYFWYDSLISFLWMTVT